MGDARKRDAPVGRCAFTERQGVPHYNQKEGQPLIMSGARVKGGAPLPVFSAAMLEERHAAPFRRGLRSGF